MAAGCFRGKHHQLEGIILSDSQQWLTHAQDLMSSTASNYDMSKLITGQGLATLALLFTIAAASSIITSSFMAVTPLIAITVTYGMMMFASSYVEEEQHFWYWGTTAWLMLLWVKKYVSNSNFHSKLTLGSNRIWKDRRLLALIGVGIIITMRVARRWNQTGQKFTAEPDIGRTFLFQHRIFFWTIFCITYLCNLQSLANTGFPHLSQLLAGVMVTALVTSAVTFKLAFTYADSPELMVGVVKLLAENDVGMSLVLRARIVFIAILIAVVYSIVSGFKHPKGANRKSFPNSQRNDN